MDRDIFTHIADSSEAMNIQFNDVLNDLLREAIDIHQRKEAEAGDEHVEK